MSNRFALALWCAAFVVASGSRAAAAAVPRAHVVVSITMLPGRHPEPTMTLPNGRAQTLAVRQPVPDGARIDVPLGVIVVIASTDSKSTTTLRPDTSYTAVSTGRGEVSRIEHGSALFSVVHGALNFFQVKYGTTFTASAKGTVFSVNASRGSVTFACERGQIDVGYAAKLRIASGVKDNAARADPTARTAPSVAVEPQVRAVQVITPATRPSVTFSADAPEAVRRFGSASEAEAAYRQELAAAKATGDLQRIAGAYNNLGIVDAVLGAFVPAVRNFDEALRFDPRDAIIYYNRGIAYAENHDAARALASYDAAIDIDPAFGDAYTNRGVLRAGSGDHERAIRDFDTALGVRSSDPATVYYDRAISYGETGRIDRAIADYDRAIQLVPTFAKALVNRGVAHVGRHDYVRAMADYDLAIRTEPIALAYVNRGMLYEAEADGARALADFNTAIALDATSARAYSERGALYDGSGEHDRAIADYEHAIRLAPALSANYFNRGFAYLAKGDRTRADADFSTSIRLAPTLKEPYLARGITNLHGGSLVRARADLEKAAELAPADGIAALLLDIADRRSNMPSRLPVAVTRIDMNAWPAPILRVFLGRAPASSAVAAASEGDSAGKPQRLCEAYYYTAELAALQGATAEARTLYQSSIDVCPLFLQRAISKAAIQAL